MNPKPNSETDAIRSDIEMTRRRMDETINALGERVKGRHLIDEAIGYFRRHREQTSEAGSHVREKVSEKFSQTADKISAAAGTAGKAVVDTVKKNPLPFVLIAAGAAWLTYSLTRKRGAADDNAMEDPDRYDPDTHYDRPLEYPGSASAVGSAMDDMTNESSSKFQQMKDSIADKASDMTDQAKDKLSDLSDRAKDKFHSVKDRASQLGSQVQDRTKEMYARSRDKVAQTADEHPVELGLCCLVAGVLIGLAIPTPEPVNRIAGPTVDRLRNRTKEAGRDMLQKGKRVVAAAKSAAQHEAESQGLTPDALKRSGEAVANRAGEAAQDAASEGDACDISGNPRAGTEPADPSAARPAQ